MKSSFAISSDNYINYAHIFLNLKRFVPTIRHAFLGVAPTQSTVSVIMDLREIHELIDAKHVC